MKVGFVDKIALDREHCRKSDGEEVRGVSWSGVDSLRKLLCACLPQYCFSRSRHRSEHRSRLLTALSQYKHFIIYQIHVQTSYSRRIHVRNASQYVEFEPNAYSSSRSNSSSFPLQIFLLTLTLGIIERFLANTHSPYAISLPLALNIVRRGMEDGAIVPDRNIIHILPLEPDLQIMIVADQSHEPLQQSFAFELGHVVDVSDVGADREDGLPTCHWVGAHYGMDGSKLRPDILR